MAEALQAGIPLYLRRGADGELEVSPGQAQKVFLAHYTRPDTDNLQKLLKDVLTGLGFWKDDALVAVEHVDKRWADRPGIYIKIEPLPPTWRDP